MTSSVRDVVWNVANAERSARARYFWVAVLSLAALVTWLPDVRRDFGHPLGDSAISVDYNGKIIDAGPQAVAAGVKLGDTIDLGGMTPGQRLFVNEAESADAQGIASVPLISHGRHHVAHIKVRPEVPNVPVVVL